MLEYIDTADNSKRMDVVLLSGECFEPGQLTIALKLLKRGTEIVPIRFDVHGGWDPEEPTFIGLETDEASRSIPQKDLIELAKRWKPSQSGITDVNGKRVIISDYLWDTEGYFIPDKPDCDWHSDEYVRGWNNCRQAAFEFYDV